MQRQMEKKKKPSKWLVRATFVENDVSRLCETKGKSHNGKERKKSAQLLPKKRGKEAN